jgi:hypothetical protein
MLCIRRGSLFPDTKHVTGAHRHLHLGRALMTLPPELDPDRLLALELSSRL